MIINKPQIILQPKKGKDEEHTLQLKSKIKSQKIFAQNYVPLTPA